MDQNAWCLQIFAPQVFFERYMGLDFWSSTWLVDKILSTYIGYRLTIYWGLWANPLYGARGAHMPQNCDHFTYISFKKYLGSKDLKTSCILAHPTLYGLFRPFYKYITDYYAARGSLKMLQQNCSCQTVTESFA